MSRRVYFGLYGDQSFWSTKGWEVDIDPEEDNYFQKRTEGTRWSTNKYIAHAGVASRRKAEELIKQGLVTVNGQVVRELATIIKTGDRVEVGDSIYNEERSTIFK